jgi:hypothetical protein
MIENEQVKNVLLEAVDEYKKALAKSSKISKAEVNLGANSFFLGIIYGIEVSNKLGIKGVKVNSKVVRKK